MEKFLNLKDEEVVEIVRTKDRNLYAEIIRRYEKKLLRYAVSIVGDRQKGEDVVQDGFIKAFINLNSFNTKKKFSSWIYRIIHNEAINIIKKDKKQKSIENLDFDSGINLEDEIIKKEIVEHTQECLKKIPFNYRECLSLYYLEEKSYEEISDILRIPIGTVGTRINRGKIIMKKICQKLK